MKYVVAVDGSDESDEAVRYAVEIAEATESELHVVHSVTPEIYSESGEVLIEDMSEAESRAERVLEEAERIAGEEGYDVTAEVLYGDAADEVTEYADEVGADGIFVGHRGVSGKHSEMVGSVAQDMIRKAEVPVTVVR